MKHKIKVKRWLKRLLYIMAIFLLPILIYLLVGVILSLVSTRPENQECSEKQNIYISSNGVHLDIILHREVLGDSLAGVKAFGCPESAVLEKWDGYAFDPFTLHLIIYR